jgi:hypothetical protein
MSKLQIYNRLGESALGALIGSSVEYGKARKGGEDQAGRVISALSGGTIGAIAAVAGSAGIRNIKTSRNLKKVVKDSNYVSMVDRLASLENKLDEKVTRYKAWSREDALNRHYVSQKPMIGYPQKYEGAMEMLSQRQTDLTNQRALMQQIGDPSFSSNPQGYLDATVASARAGRMEKDISTLKNLSNSVSKSTRDEFMGIKGEQEFIQEQIKQQKIMQREYVDAQQDSFSNKINDLFMGMI